MSDQPDGVASVGESPVSSSDGIQRTHKPTNANTTVVQGMGKVLQFARRKTATVALPAYAMAA